MELINIAGRNDILPAFALILIGCAVLGAGIGMLLNEIWASTLLGVGIGFLINAYLFLRSYGK